MTEKESVYICGLSTEPSKREKDEFDRLCEEITGLCEELFGIQVLVPDKHYHPIVSSDATPEEIYLAVIEQVEKKSLCVIAITNKDSWDCGVVVEIALDASVPVIFMSHIDTEVSPLLIGNPSKLRDIRYSDTADAFEKITEALEDMDHTYTRYFERLA